MEMMRRFERLSVSLLVDLFWTTTAHLHFDDLVFPKPEFFQRGQCVQIFDFLNGSLCQLFARSLCMRASYSTNPNLVRAQLQVRDSGQFLQALDPGDLVLHEEDLGQLLQMRDILDMLDLVEAQIQAGQVMELLQALDVGDEVIVEIEFGQTGSDIRREVDA